MRVLLTGGAGYVGSACLRYLLRSGYEAFAYDNLTDGFIRTTNFLEKNNIKYIGAGLSFEEAKKPYIIEFENIKNANLIGSAIAALS